MKKLIIEGLWPDEDTWVKREYLKELKDPEWFRKAYFGEWEIPEPCPYCGTTDFKNHKYRCPYK